ncbi:MAG: ABC transporter permease, partial [Acidobacteriota bacterium]
ALSTEALEAHLVAGGFLTGFWKDLRLDPTVALAAALTACALACLATAIPALRAASAAPAEALRQGSGGNSHGVLGTWLSALVTVEVAATVVLLVVSGTALHRTLELRSFDPGFEPAGRLAVKLTVTEGATGRDRSPERTPPHHRFEQVRRGLEENPSVRTVAFASSLPTEGSFRAAWNADGVTEAFQARWLVVSPGFFTALGAPLVAGRPFTDGDGKGSERVALVNVAFARRHLQFGGEASPGDAVGRRIRPSGGDGPWLRVVGVVPDLVMGAVDDARGPEAVYLPLAQVPRTSIAMVVEAEPGHTLSTGDLRRGVAAAGPEVAGFGERTLTSMLERRRWAYDFVAGLFSAFGLLALVLSLAGLYATVGLAARLRRKEHAIRLALGAAPAQIRGAVFGVCIRPLALGLGLGIAAAAALRQALAAALPGGDLWLPGALGAVALLAAAGLGAGLRPAVEASTTEPAGPLRS